MNDRRATRTSVKVFAVLMGLYGIYAFFMLYTGLTGVDRSFSAGFAEIVIVVAWAISMVVAANGL